MQKTYSIDLTHDWPKPPRGRVEWRPAGVKILARCACPRPQVLGTMSISIARQSQILMYIARQVRKWPATWLVRYLPKHGRRVSAIEFRAEFHPAEQSGSPRLPRESSKTLFIYTRPLPGGTMIS